MSYFLKQVVGHIPTNLIQTREFRELFGPKPWDLINDIFDLAKISYRINAPEGHRDLDYKATLKTLLMVQKFHLTTYLMEKKFWFLWHYLIYNVTENKKKHSYY